MDLIYIIFVLVLGFYCLIKQLKYNFKRKKNVLSKKETHTNSI